MTRIETLYRRVRQRDRFVHFGCDPFTCAGLWVVADITGFKDWHNRVKG